MKKLNFKELEILDINIWNPNSIVISTSNSDFYLLEIFSESDIAQPVLKNEQKPELLRSKKTQNELIFDSRNASCHISSSKEKTDEEVIYKKIK